MNLRQVQTWYGPPGSLAASQRGTDIALIGASEENLLLAASFIARGQSVAIISGSTGHRILLHPANTTVPHDEFYRALTIDRPTVLDDEIWNDRGDKLFILGWKRESLECFFRVLSSKPNCVRAWVNLSRYFMDPEVQDFATATLCAERAVELDPRCDMAFANLGGIAFARHDLPATVDYCSRAVAINNDNFFGHYYLAGVLTQAGDHSPAKKREILHHALRCRYLIDQCPQAGPIVEQTIVWCEEV